MSRRLVVVVMAGLVLVAGGRATWRLAQPQTPLQQALSMTPVDVDRVSWTDWDAVRHELGAELGTDSSAADVRAFLDGAFSADLSPMSALASPHPSCSSSSASPRPRSSGSCSPSRPREAGSQGCDITLDLRPDVGQYVLSDLTSGPVLRDLLVSASITQRACAAPHRAGGRSRPATGARRTHSQR